MVAEEGDPRYLGYAEAALAPWWNRPNAPPEVVLLRASLRLARADYDGAEQDLRALIESPAPEGHAARITRASLHLSKGDSASALADCKAASDYVSRLVASACVAGARSLAGDSAGALADLEDALDSALRQAVVGQFPELREVELVDYKVRILTPEDGTKAVTRVMIESAG